MKNTGTPLVCRFCFFNLLLLRACEAGGQDLDAGIAEDLQGGPDVGLELVLHSGEAQQLHLHLQALNHRGHLQRAVMDAKFGLDIACLGRGRMGKIFGVGVDEISINKAGSLRDQRQETARNRGRKYQYGCQLWKT